MQKEPIVPTYVSLKTVDPHLLIFVCLLRFLCSYNEKYVSPDDAIGRWKSDRCALIDLEMQERAQPKGLPEGNSVGKEDTWLTEP